MKKAAFALLIVLTFSLNGCLWSKYRKAAVQSEARTNLASIATAQISYYSEKDTWGQSFELIGWTPFGDNRYSFYLNTCEEVIPSNTTGFTGCPEELKKALTDCHEKALKDFEESKKNPNSILILKEPSFCAAAVANLDKDPKLDIWIIDENKMPLNVSDDKVK